MNKERMAQFHKENILTAADELFNKLGFENTTIEMISKEAQYSKPTIYAYFDSKEEIYAANLYIYMLKFQNGFEEILSLALPAKEIYLKCCHWLLKFKNEHLIYFLGIIGAVDYKNHLKTENSLLICELGETINKKVCQAFSKAICEGLVGQNIDIDFSYTYIWSCVIGLLTSAKLKPSSFPSKDEYEATLDKYFLMIAEGLFNANK